MAAPFPPTKSPPTQTPQTNKNSHSEWIKNRGQAKCCGRFSEAINEVEEAAKCFAFARYTACAFHLMRLTEAGVRAFGAAIGHPTGNDPNWGRILKEYDIQLAKPPAARPAQWATHGDFLEEIGADIRAINKAWRNRVAHLDATYTEERALLLLRVIPEFMRHLATKVDANGVLY